MLMCQNLAMILPPYLPTNNIFQGQISYNYQNNLELLNIFFYICNQTCIINT